MIPTIVAVVIGFILLLLGLAVYAVVLAHEEAKTERRKFAQIAQANSESIIWPIPPGPKQGAWKQKRKAA